MQCGAGRIQNILGRGESANGNCAGGKAGGARQKQRRYQRARVKRSIIPLSYKHARFFITPLGSRLFLRSRVRILRTVRVFVMIAANGGMFGRDLMVVMGTTAERRMGGRHGNHQKSCEQLHIDIVAVKS
jgi:hypothetical protein